MIFLPQNINFPHSYPSKTKDLGPCRQAKVLVTSAQAHFQQILILRHEFRII